MGHSTRRHSGQAILDANVSVHTIEPLSDLPTITDPVSLDGETQPGYRFPSGPPLIQLLGDQDTGTTVPRVGLAVSTGKTDIGALSIGDFDQAIVVGPFGTGNRIALCVIGADPQGLTATPNRIGIYIDGYGNTVGGSSFGTGNLISGNTVAGVDVEIGDGHCNRPVRQHVRVLGLLPRSVR